MHRASAECSTDHQHETVTTGTSSLQRSGRGADRGATRWWAAGLLVLAMLQGAAPQAAGVALVAPDEARARGNPEAPVVLIEYSDFTCGFCLRFFRETWPRLEAKYVQSGLVRFVYRDFPRGGQGGGLVAAMAARCAGEQGRYWQMHDRLFGGDGRVGAAEIERHARAVGLEQGPFVSCMREGRHLSAIQRDRDEGVALGFRGTPGFVLVHAAGTERERPVVIPGAFPFEVFDEQIQRLLTAAKRKG